MTVRGVRFYFEVKVQVDIDDTLCESVLKKAQNEALAKLTKGNIQPSQFVLKDWEAIEGPAREAE